MTLVSAWTTYPRDAAKVAHITPYEGRAICLRVFDDERHWYRPTRDLPICSDCAARLWKAVAS